MKFAALFLAIAALALADPIHAQDWQVGFGKEIITPEKSMWLAGYGSRTKPSEGKITELFAKAMALQSPGGAKAVLVTLDLVGIDRDFSLTVRKKLKDRFGLNLWQVMLACSHTHSGPVVGNNLRSMYFFDKEQQQLVIDYTAQLEDKIVAVVDRALKDLAPCKVAWTIGACGFAVNRRENVEKDVPKLREAGMLKGPVDHDVPVLALHDLKGKLRGVVFGYACHATVLSGQEWCSDYPGFAQFKLEEDHPGATALFWAGCGADQNPLPRRSVALAKKYGHELADAVNAALSRPMKPIEGGVRLSYREVSIDLDDLPTHKELTKEAMSADKYVAARAQMWLDKIKKGGALPLNYLYPVQLWRLGELHWLSMGGEVVVDYSLRIKKEIGPGTTWVTAYANDVMAYIPSQRVLKEGRYEGATSMIYYGLPTVWGSRIEDTIMNTVRQVCDK